MPIILIEASSVSEVLMPRAFLRTAFEQNSLTTEEISEQWILDTTWKKEKNILSKLELLRLETSELFISLILADLLKIDLDLEFFINENVVLTKWPELLFAHIFCETGISLN